MTKVEEQKSVKIHKALEAQAYNLPKVIPDSNHGKLLYFLIGGVAKS